MGGHPYNPTDPQTPTPAPDDDALIGRMIAAYLGVGEGQRDYPARMAAVLAEVRKGGV